MENFFEHMTPWARHDGSLHLYVVPGDADVARFAAAQQLIAGVNSLPPMPPALLHVTVQRLAQFDDQVTQADLSRMGTALSAELSDVASFDLDFGPPRAEASAVVCTADTTKGWEGMRAAVLRALAQALPGDLPEPPHAPHLSLAYATGHVDDAVIAARLEGAEPVGRVRVAQVHLVSVTVRPSNGTFDFTNLANWELA